ncbi:MAG: 4-hydroxy-tetrahydrodipicolinate reductase [Candidatus Goldiibacteriota bacterium]
MVKIAIPGAAGRMGEALIETAEKTAGIEASFLLERKGHEAVGTEIKGLKVSDDLDSNTGRFDVFVDFTVPKASIENLKILVREKKALVLATTGFNKEELAEIEEASKIIPVVFASNYSVGVNVMWKVLKDMTKIMKEDYDIDIVESHHRHKKDAPSGTAVTCAEVIMNEKELDYEKNVVYGRSGRDNERNRGQLGVLAVRGGGVIGEHTVIYAGDEDKLELKHTSFSRKTFASGALKAAVFAAGKKPGLYGMDEVLGF